MKLTPEAAADFLSLMDERTLVVSSVNEEGEQASFWEQFQIQSLRPLKRKQALFWLRERKVPPPQIFVLRVVLKTTAQDLVDSLTQQPSVLWVERERIFQVAPEQTRP